MRSPEDSHARGGSAEAATVTEAPPVAPPGPDAAGANEPVPEAPAAESHPGAKSWLARLIRRLTGGSEEDFVLQIVQPSLVGLIDGTVSTLAPIFAAAVSTNSRTALLVGIATALGAGVSMGMSEALSDTGEITNRGSALVRGIITGGATALGGIFHSLPFLIKNVNHALVVAGIVVGIELFVIAWVRYKFLHVSLRSSLVVVTLGGAIVLGIGVLVGSS
jgi:hypothetical protein